ncbi:MAG: class I SAM-dependent rRNA methyltransferase [Epsilonproteobacteria bacterium]|nr:class I SAM-dependent rRNA methyltransferase [Campylobacterota bacterium]NPA57306.1 class I SAM-dependent rRNA methyltransferase [Campylobacterota bacterium]
MKKVVVSPKAVRLLRSFFPWVYRGEIVEGGDLPAGELVEVVDGRGRFLGIGYLNMGSLIALRILSFRRVSIDLSFFKERIKEAQLLRSSIPSNAYRIVHSEGDGLPGLIVDRYDDLLVVHLTTAGILRFKEVVVRALEELYTPRGMVVVGEEKYAEREGFRPFLERVGECGPRVVEEYSIRFRVDPLRAQKTGHYLDQRRNREIVTTFLPQGGSLLDCFSNTGGFALYGAIKKGARVRLVDLSGRALEQARENFALNGVQGEFIVANVFDYLRSIRGKELFDMVVLDPPSFTRSRSGREGALRGFKDLAVNGMKVVRDRGYLALFSCSHHVTIEDLKGVILKGAVDNRKRVVIREHLYQDHDHPILPSVPSSLYLTGLLCQIFHLP